MAQFRTGILPLHIETGKFRDKRIYERVCLFCNSGEVENELHFRCVCTTYSNNRQKMYSIVNNDNLLKMSNDEKFLWLGMSLYMLLMLSISLSRCVSGCCNLFRRVMFQTDQSC